MKLNQQDIDNDVNKMLHGMTQEEILQEQQELLQSLSPGLIELFKKRAEKKEELKKKTIEHKNPPINENTPSDPVISLDDQNHSLELSKQFLPSSDFLPSSSKQEVNSTIDLSTIRTEEELKEAARHLPYVERCKLAWIYPDIISPEENPFPTSVPDAKSLLMNEEQKEDSEDTKKPTSIRYDFDGNLIQQPDQCDSRYYHHGQESDKPGYTIDELLLLVRSSVQGQRVIGLTVLRNILYQRSLSQLYYMDLEESALSSLVLKTLLVALNTTVSEEILLCLQCFIHILDVPGELNRSLLNSIFYYGYERVCPMTHSQGSFSPIEKDEEEEKEDHLESTDYDKNIYENESKFTKNGCEHIVSVLVNNGLIDRLLKLLLSKHTNDIYIYSLYLLCLCCERSNKACLTVLIDSHFLESYKEEYLLGMDMNDTQKIIEIIQHTEKGSIFMTHAKDENQVMEVVSSRVYMLMNEGYNPITIFIFYLYLLEIMCIKNKKCAEFLVDHHYLNYIYVLLSIRTRIEEENELVNTYKYSIIEGCLTLLRVFYNYNYDLQNIDTFIDSYATIDHYHNLALSSLCWSIYTCGLYYRQSFDVEDLFLYTNTLISTALDLLVDPTTGFTLKGSILGFLFTYMDILTKKDLSKDLQERTYHQMKDILSIYLKADIKKIEENLQRTYSFEEEWFQLLVQRDNLQSKMDRYSVLHYYTLSEYQYLSFSNFFYCFSRFIYICQSFNPNLHYLLECFHVPQVLLMAFEKPYSLLKTTPPFSSHYMYIHRYNYLAILYVSFYFTELLTNDILTPNSYQPILYYLYSLPTFFLRGDEYLCLSLYLNIIFNYEVLDKVSNGFFSSHNITGREMISLVQVYSQYISSGGCMEYSRMLWEPASWESRDTLFISNKQYKSNLPLVGNYLLTPLFNLRTDYTLTYKEVPPFVIHTYSEVMSFLTLFDYFYQSKNEYWLKTSTALSYYALLHMILVTFDTLYNNDVLEKLRSMFTHYLHYTIEETVTPRSEYVVRDCSHHKDNIQLLYSVLPKKDMNGFVTTLVNIILEKSFGETLYNDVLLLFLFNCRDKEIRKEVYTSLMENGVMRYILYYPYSTDLLHMDCYDEDNEDIIKIYTDILLSADLTQVKEDPCLFVYLLKSVLQYIKNGGKLYKYYERKIQETFSSSFLSKYLNSLLFVQSKTSPLKGFTLHSEKRKSNEK